MRLRLGPGPGDERLLRPRDAHSQDPDASGGEAHAARGEAHREENRSPGLAGSPGGALSTQPTRVGHPGNGSPGRAFLHL